MIKFFKEFLNTFEEVHYFLGGVSIGVIVTTFVFIFIIAKVIIPAVKRRNGNCK